MTRSDIADAIYRSVGVSRAQAYQMAGFIVEHIAAALERGESVKIPKFGTFLLNDKAQSEGRNPKMGEKDDVTARRVVQFLPSVQLRDRIAPPDWAAKSAAGSDD